MHSDEDQSFVWNGPSALRSVLRQIAWQTLNKVASPQGARFAKRFLIVTPGLTIRDRLRVLRPEHEENYYKLRDLVPADLKGICPRPGL
jgi:hypothetical protein